MTYKFNVTGERRKELVNAISTYCGKPKKYLGMPSCAFEVGSIRIEKDGTVIAPNLDESTAKHFITEMATLGFIAENEMTTEPTAEPTPTEQRDDKLTLEMPRDNFTDTAMTNLENLVSSKGSLIKKAIGTDTLIIERSEEKIRFPWFQADATSDEVTAYSQFIAALCKTAKEKQRVNPQEIETDNEKFSFRVWLVSLGMKGSEYKSARKILMANLTGDSAFRYGKPERTPKTP